MKEEYIDVNRVKENLITEIYSHSKGDIRKRLFARGLSLAYDIVNRQPTVDAVEVVRCKDCVSCDRDDGSPWCGLVGLHVDDDHYCAWGEREDEVTECTTHT